MKKTITISICVLNFIMAMIMILILPNKVPFELTGGKVSELSNKWLGLVHAILPVAISLSTLLERRYPDRPNLDVSYQRRNNLSTILSFLWIIAGWVILAINNNNPVIGAKITLPLVSLIILVVTLLWTAFICRFSEAKTNNPTKHFYFIWTNLVGVGVIFVFATLGVILQDALWTIIVQAVLIVLVIVAAFVLPDLLAKLNKPKPEPYVEKYIIHPDSEKTTMHKYSKAIKLKASYVKSARLKKED